MRKIVFSTLLGLLLGVSPIIAQNSNTSKQGRHGGGQNQGDQVTRRLEMLKKDLSLTDDQSAQVKTALEAHQQKLETGKSLTTEAEKKSLRDTADSELDAKMKSILSADQYTKYKAKQDEMKNHGGGQHGGGNGGGHHGQHGN